VNVECAAEVIETLPDHHALEFQLKLLRALAYRKLPPIVVSKNLGPNIITIVMGESVAPR
jgi:hypothetical protein